MKNINNNTVIQSHTRQNGFPDTLYVILYHLFMTGLKTYRPVFVTPEVILFSHKSYRNNASVSQDLKYAVKRKVYNDERTMSQ